MNAKELDKNFGEGKVRLDSLDALRGFDLFVLCMLGPVMHCWLGHHPDGAWQVAHWTHATWEGLLMWDLVMPLFMFMAGVSLPFAMAKYLEGDKKSRVLALWRIARRVVLLWLLGCVAQGNLLSFDLAVFKPFSNTLQAIAVGYAGAALAFLFLDFRKQLILFVALLALFTAGCFCFGDWQSAGTSPWERELNFPATLDKILLGTWRDGARTDASGNVIFSDGYDTAWIFCSLTFVATVMSGVFAGTILKNKAFPQIKKCALLILAGLAMLAVGWICHVLGMPVIKRIWTASFVLVASGWCFLLMALFYAIIDWFGCKCGIGWLKIIGMNSILAYMLSPEVGLIRFDSITRPLLSGFAKTFEIARPEILFACGNALILFLILWLCARAKVFLKV